MEDFAKQAEVLFGQETESKLPTTYCLLPTAKVLNKILLINNPDYAARLLGLDPQSDEAACEIQRLLDEADEAEKVERYGWGKECGR